MDRGSKSLLVIAVLGALLYGFLNWRIFDANQQANMPEEHYQRGLDMMRRNDWGSAVFYYQKAAAAGHGKAQINLGVAYIEGRGVEQNIPLACQYFAQALQQQKDLRNYHNVIQCYAQGLNHSFLALIYLAQAEKKLSPQDWHYLQPLQSELLSKLSASQKLTMAFISKAPHLFLSHPKLFIHQH